MTSLGMIGLRRTGLGLGDRPDVRGLSGVWIGFHSTCVPNIPNKRPRQDSRAHALLEFQHPLLGLPPAAAGTGSGGRRARTAGGP